MQSDEKNVFSGKSFSSLMKDIYDNSTHKKKQIQILIDELRVLVNSANEASLIVPLIKDYLDVGVKNDEQLIKMASVYQKYVSSEDKINYNMDKSSSGIMLTEQEKQDLLNTISYNVFKSEKLEESDEILDTELTLLKNKNVDTINKLDKNNVS